MQRIGVLPKISRLSKDTVRPSISLQDSATFLDLLSHYKGMGHSKVDNHHITFVWFKRYTMKKKKYTKWIPSILLLPSYVLLGWAWNHLNIYERISYMLSHRGKQVLHWSFLWITPKLENSHDDTWNLPTFSPRQGRISVFMGVRCCALLLLLKVQDVTWASSQQKLSQKSLAINFKLYKIIPKASIKFYWNAAV